MFADSENEGRLGLLAPRGRFRDAGGGDQDHKCQVDLSGGGETSSTVMYNLGVGPRFAYVSASARPQNNKLPWGPF